ncbi:hypothetical protein BC567DRAFT_160966 [Phyllosticta citribraziliensis]
MPDSQRTPHSGSPDQKGATGKAGPRVDFEEGDVGDVQSGHVDASDHTHRRLKPRHIQLIGIAGTIGTALFVNIGKGLLSGGPASLFMAYCLW